MSLRKVKHTALNFTEHGPSTVVGGLLIVIAATVTALACGWSLVTDHSVRFNELRTGRGFYRLPPLPLMYDQKTGKEVSALEIENYLYPENSEFESASEAVPESEKVWEHVVSSIQQNDLPNVRKSLQKFVEATALPTIEEEPVRQKRRNTARDLLDALGAMKHGSGNQAINAYLAARLAFDEHPAEMPAETSPVLDRNLRDNWAYLRAAILYSTDQKQLALEAFRKHVVQFPGSEKNEAVRYMIAKITMESSNSFGKMNCGIMGKRGWEREEIEASDIEPAENCKDENWHAAVNAFEQVLQKYPNGRYATDARGWLAYLYRRGSERAKALAEYYRLLGHPTDRPARLQAKKSLQFIGHEYDDQTLDEVERMIADDVNAALAYAYHRIYNHAIDFTYEEISPWCCSGDDRWQQKNEEEKRVTDAVRVGNHELERIANFATAMMKRHPQARVSGAFVIRVAEAQLELKNYREALRSADRAIKMGIQSELRMEGLWVKGSAEHQLKQLASARSTFRKLIEEFPNTKLTEGARRLIAITAEDQGDLETALEIYIDLNYEYDIAYFVDVLLPTERLAQFINDRKDIPQFNRLLYALGIRYMRDKRWNEARETLRQVRTEKGTDEYLESDKNATWHFAKEPGYGEDLSYIKTSWVMQDLKTIDIFEYYEQAAVTAEGDESKAEAMYQLASSLYESDDLVFYNPALWDGGRSSSLTALQFSDHVRIADESRIIFEHLQAHDPLARAIPIYEEIVARFPKTTTARDALYSAAVAHERLSGRHSAWAALYERGLFAGTRIITYADVKSSYPNYQLPRGTYGWEPSTRTVNGGPGWAPPPKPPPKLTKEQKIKGIVGRLYNEFQPKVEQKLDAVVERYDSSVESVLNVVQTVILVMLGAYVFLLWVHFSRPEWLLPPAEAADYYAATMRSQQIVPDSESRMEKVIDGENP